MFSEPQGSYQKSYLLRSLQVWQESPTGKGGTYCKRAPIALELMSRHSEEFPVGTSSIILAIMSQGGVMLACVYGYVCAHVPNTCICCSASSHAKFGGFGVATVL